METLRLAKLDSSLVVPFDCGRADQNEFLHDWAWKEQLERLSTTYLHGR